ncbi:MAG: hypothetical protein ABR878_00770 [Roseiarcus sp.]|jgi:hypothetical protein
MTTVTQATTTKRHECYQAFDLDVAAIDTIWKIIQDYGHSPKVVFSCSDNSTIESLNLDTLTKFTNTDDRQICSVTFRCTGYAPPQIELSFTRYKDYGACIKYSISGDDKDVLHVSRSLNDVIRNCGVWYSTLTAMSPYEYGARSASLTALGLALLLIVVVSFYFIYISPEIMKSDSVRNATIIIGGISNILLFFISIVRFSNPIIQKLFPPAVFEIGVGMKRSESSKYWRNFIGGGVILAILTGLAAIGLYEHVF